MESIRLRPLQKEELGKYIAVGSGFFPDADWAGAPGRLGAMFDRWGEGILAVMNDDGDILGYYTLWPITGEAFGGFESGALKDEDMCIDRMPLHPHFPQRHWILTAVAVKPSKPVLRRDVILSIVRDLFARAEKNAPCQVLAHAATWDGHRFLRRTGFEVRNPDEPTVYILTINSNR